jgi:hypothetical protein
MASLELKFPNGGETLVLNQVSPITWQATGITTTNTLKIELVNTATNKTYLIDDNAPILAEWAYSWKVGKNKTGETIPPANQYRIRITTLETTPHSALSQATFTIKAAKRLTITSPTSFNVWDMESQRSIQWQDPGQLGGSVQLFLKPVNSSSSTPGLHPISAAVPTTSGHYTWTVGSTQDNATIKPGTFSVVIRHAASGSEEESGSFSITTKNEDLIPSQLIDNHWWRRHAYSRKWICGGGLDTQGQAPPDAPDQRLRVGYENSYSKSFCVERQLSFFYRAYFLFNLQGIKKKVKKATLTLTIASSQVSQGSSASNAGCCAGALHRLTAAFSDGNTPVEKITPISPPSSGQQISLDLTSLVKEWVAGTRPNHGLMLQGINESLEKNNNACVSFFVMPTLLLEYEPFL